MYVKNHYPWNLLVFVLNLFFIDSATQRLHSKDDDLCDDCDVSAMSLR